MTNPDSDTLALEKKGVYDITYLDSLIGFPWQIFQTICQEFSSQNDDCLETGDDSKERIVALPSRLKITDTLVPHLSFRGARDSTSKATRHHAHDSSQISSLEWGTQLNIYLTLPQPDRENFGVLRIGTRIEVLPWETTESIYRINFSSWMGFGSRHHHGAYLELDVINDHHWNIIQAVQKQFVNRVLETPKRIEVCQEKGGREEELALYLQTLIRPSLKKSEAA